ncbi:MAG TPA: hypothetical protein VLZ50_08825 [Terracidiphilus sp.]|nr:hypothetical protein [Terracidiphilus sp.]
MIVEMRTYRLKPGCRPKFLEVFRTKSMPAHAEIGLNPIGRVNASRNAGKGLH